MRIADSTREHDRSGEQTAPLKTCMLSWLALSAGGWLVIAGAVYAVARALS
ncbi:hypothetical protein [Desertibaculum subflavum]|uniref:hypothetical protein n=1 Tax=Desertibaculum subflavum TaxID=2268458 RepID=UPI0013C4420A